jgi:protein TonB
MKPRKEKLSGPATVSIVLHGALVALVVFPLGFRSRPPLWGGEGSGGQAVSVSLKSSIPIPAAPVETPLATDSKSENLPEPEVKKPKAVEPPPPPKPNDYLIKNDKKSRQERLDQAKKELTAELAKDMRRPSNAVPGSGGRASSQMYGMTAPSAGSGGIGFGGDFGSRYSFYVHTVQTCLSNHWQETRPDTMATNIPKAYVAFEIVKDGAITNEHITTSSGIPSVDRDAINSVVACSGRSGSEHLPALPRDFEGGRVPVEVWFATKQ